MCEKKISCEILGALHVKFDIEQKNIAQNNQISQFASDKTRDNLTHKCYYSCM